MVLLVIEIGEFIVFKSILICALDSGSFEVVPFNKLKYRSKLFEYFHYKILIKFFSFLEYSIN